MCAGNMPTGGGGEPISQAITSQLRDLTKSVEEIAKSSKRPGRSWGEKWANYIGASLLAVFLPIVGLIYTVLNNSIENERIAIEKNETVERLINEKKEEATSKLFSLNSQLNALDYRNNSVRFINETVSRISPQVDLILRNELVEESPQTGQVFYEIAKALDIASRLYFLKRNELITMAIRGRQGMHHIAKRNRGPVPSFIIEMEIRFFERAAISLKESLSMEDVGVYEGLLGAYAKRISMISRSVSRDDDKQIPFLAQKAINAFHAAVENLPPEHIRTSRKVPITERPRFVALYGPLSAISKSMRRIRTLKTSVADGDDDTADDIVELQKSYADALSSGSPKWQDALWRAASYVRFRMGDELEQFEAYKIDTRRPYFFLKQWYELNFAAIKTITLPKRGLNYDARFKKYMAKLKKKVILLPLPQEFYWNFFNYEYWSPTDYPEQKIYINKHLMPS